MTDADPRPPSRDTVSGVVGGRVFRVAVLAVIVGVVVVVIVRQGGDNKAPAPQSLTPVPSVPVPLSDDKGELPTTGAIAEGTAANGSAWSLTVGGAPDEACLTIEVPEGSGDPPTACTGPPAPAGSLPLQQAFAPRLQADERWPTFVYGRVPNGVVEVEVILADGGSLGRVPVARGVGGPFYAVEVTSSQAIAVFGYNQDGTSLRFDLPR